MEKKIVTDGVSFRCIDLDKLTVPEAIKYIQELEQKAINKGITNLKFDIDVEGDWDASCLEGEREETDEEYEYRTNLENRRKETEKQREQQELEQYIRLKAKYDDKLDIQSTTFGDELIVRYKEKK